ncbi:hypothetical protein [Heyndrickxia sp. FSL W8-0423]
MGDFQIFTKGKIKKSLEMGANNEITVKKLTKEWQSHSYDVSSLIK